MHLLGYYIPATCLSNYKLNVNLSQLAFMFNYISIWVRRTRSLFTLSNTDLKSVVSLIDVYSTNLDKKFENQYHPTGRIPFLLPTSLSTWTQPAVTEFPSIALMTYVHNYISITLYYISSGVVARILKKSDVWLTAPRMHMKNFFFFFFFFFM